MFPRFILCSIGILVGCASAAAPPAATADAAAQTAADTTDGSTANGADAGNLDLGSGDAANDPGAGQADASAADGDISLDGGGADADASKTGDSPTAADSAPDADAVLADPGPASDACEPTCKPDCSDGCGGTCNGTKCDDGVACTVNDTCEAGKCVPQTILCECSTDAQCAKKASAPPPCGPTYVCDKSSANWQCKVIVAAQVCPAATNNCHKNVCDPATGACTAKPVNESEACDDGDKCTGGEYCESGICQFSFETCECKSSADCAKLEDGDLCNGSLVCDIAAGKCTVDPKSLVTCDTSKDTVCVKTFCVKKTGKCTQTPMELLGKSCPANDPGCPVYVPLPPDVAPNIVPCQDDDACTGSSFCGQGKCIVQATSLLCGCTTDAQCAKYGDLCSGPLVCDTAKGMCKPNAQVALVCTAKDDKPCLKNTCPPAAGKCMMLPPPCWDANSCTVDSCDPASGCKFSVVADGTICDDGKGACTTGKCVPKP